MESNSESRLAGPAGEETRWDHSSHEEFFSYYARESLSSASLERFRSARDAVLRVLRVNATNSRRLDVADIGCGAGTQCLLWAELGHCVHGVDVNQPLLDLARSRAEKAGYRLDLQIGSAAQLPWPEESMDVCLALELLEHVAEWRVCLKEFIRVLRPGGVLFLTTTNNLCPSQQEFNLPLYSWYPRILKERFERLAKTTRPQLANYATYPAVNWFNFYRLRAELSPSGFESLDRFDIMDCSTKGPLAKWVVSTVRLIPPLRWLAHVATPGTMILAVKRSKPLG